MSPDLYYSVILLMQLHTLSTFGHTQLSVVCHIFLLIDITRNRKMQPIIIWGKREKNWFDDINLSIGFCLGEA